MFVDALDPDALNGMPVLIAATAGTARHSLVLDHAMRPLFTYLRAVVVPTGVFAATEDFGGTPASRSGSPAPRPSWPGSSWAPTTSPASARTPAGVVRRVRPAPTSAR